VKWWHGYVNVDPQYIKGSINWGWKWISWFQGYPEDQWGKLVHCFLVCEEPDDPRSNTMYKYNVYETSPGLYRKISLDARTNGSPCIFVPMKGDGTPARDYAQKLVDNKTQYAYIAIFLIGAFMYVEKVINVVIHPYRALRQLPTFRFSKSAKAKFIGALRKWKWLGLDKVVYCTESMLDASEEAGYETPWKGNHDTANCPELFKWQMKEGYQIARETRGEPISEL